jgi:hypothetical protein
MANVTSLLWYLEVKKMTKQQKNKLNLLIHHSSAIDLGFFKAELLNFSWNVKGSAQQ